MRKRREQGSLERKFYDQGDPLSSDETKARKEAEGAHWHALMADEGRWPRTAGASSTNHPKRTEAYATRLGGSSIGNF